jgi:broad specificity phosphatase PhoE
MTTVKFVRHARSVYNDQGKMAGLHDPPLSEAGYREAQIAARFLDGTVWNAAYASPLARARDTANVILGARHAELKLEPAIQELDMGDFSGRAWDEVLMDFSPAERETVTFWQMFARDRIPNQEPYRSAVHRIMSFFERVGREHVGQTVLVVGHKGVMEVFLSETIGFDPSVDWFEISGGSISTFQIAPDRRTKIVSINVRPGSGSP